MAVLISNDAELPMPIDNVEIEAVCAYVMQAEQVERPVEISVSIVDEDEMHELNHRWRGIDRTTDVLPSSSTLPLTIAFLSPSPSSSAT